MYSGTAGRVENCQIGIFLGYATNKGRALLDRELYLPEEWFEDGERMEAAGIPSERAFHTKPLLARKMLERAFLNGVSADWVTGDEVYGRDTALKRFLEEAGRPYVLAVGTHTYVWRGIKQIKAQEAIKEGKVVWKKVSCGFESKGPKVYEWGRVRTNSAIQGYEKWLLVRKGLQNGACSYYAVFCRQGTPLERVAEISGYRWTIEECIETAKQEVGLDEYEVRSYIGWYRHITMSMLALFILNELRVGLNEKEALLFQKKGRAENEKKVRWGAF